MTFSTVDPFQTSLWTFLSKILFLQRNSSSALKIHLESGNFWVALRLHDFKLINLE